MARGLTTLNRRRELAIQNALVDRLAAGFERSLAKQLNATMIKAVRQFNKDGSDIGINSIVMQDVPRLEKLFASQYRSVMIEFGNRILSGLKSHKPTARKDVNDDFMVRVNDFIRVYALDRATSISGTTIDQLRSIIQEGSVDGLGTREIARNITERIPTIANYRSNTIARTETHSASGYASEMAATETGLNLKKEWVAFIDGREREAHAEADGQVVNRDEDFTVDGEQLAYAGDPSGSAGNIINCRCTVLYFEE